MGDRRIFLKNPATLPLTKIYRMSLISTGSILLDSTFKDAQVWYFDLLDFNDLP